VNRAVFRDVVSRISSTFWRSMQARQRRVSRKRMQQEVGRFIWISLTELAVCLNPWTHGRERYFDIFSTLTLTKCMIIMTVTPLRQICCLYIHIDLPLDLISPVRIGI
jgi:hypothetical protein